MTFPRLEIRTRQETGRLHSDLTFGDRTFHGIGGSVVDLVATMATDPNLPKEIKDWIGDTFWTENEKLKEQAGSLVDERDRLEAENGRLKEAIERQTNQILDLQAQITKFKTENGRLIGQLTVYVRENAKIERLRIRWRCLVFRMVRAKIPLLKEISKLEDEIKQKDDEINTLRAQRNKAQALNVEIHDSETTFRRQNKALQDELTGCRRKIDGWERQIKIPLLKEISGLQEQLENQNTTIRQNEGLIKALQTDLARCRQHAASSSRHIFELEQENAKLKADIGPLDHEHKELVDQIHNHQIEIQGLKDRIANFQDEAIDSDTLISDLEIKIGEANRQILSLETDNATLRAKLEKVPSTPLEEAHRTIDLLLNRLTQ